MLFKITKGDIFEDNPELMANPTFNVCTSRELKYVFLVYDYKSYLRQMQMKRRQEKAVIDAGYRMEKDGKRPDKRAREVITGSKRNVQAAITEFKTIQYDEDRELQLAVSAQFQQFTEFFSRKDKSAADLKQAAVILKEMPSLKKHQRELDEIMKLRDEEEVTGKVLSVIDEINSAIE